MKWVMIGMLFGVLSALSGCANSEFYFGLRDKGDVREYNETFKTGGKGQNGRTH